MATLITDPQTIQKYCLEKQANEAQLGKSIYQFFNQGDAIVKLRELATAAICTMVSGDGNQVQAAITEEKELGVWKKLGAKNYFALRDLVMRSDDWVQSMDASDCSDLIRLVGCWVEKGGLVGAGAGGTTNTLWQDGLSNSAAIKEAYRAGVPTDKTRPLDVKSGVENVWGDKKERFKNVTVARRDRGPGRSIEDHIK